MTEVDAILFLVVATGYILAIAKKYRPLCQVSGYLKK